MRDEKQIEAEIQAKGLNAPRLRPDDIDAAIAGEQFHVFEGTTLTVCALTLRNGFVVTGESAAASPENFDRDMGRKIARDTMPGTRFGRLRAICFGRAWPPVSSSATADVGARRNIHVKRLAFAWARKPRHGSHWL